MTGIALQYFSVIPKKSNIADEFILVILIAGFYFESEISGHYHSISMHQHAITGRHDAIKILFSGQYSSIKCFHQTRCRGNFIPLCGHSIANIHEIAKLFPVYNSGGQTMVDWSCPASAPTVCDMVCTTPNARMLKATVDNSFIEGA